MLKLHEKMFKFTLNYSKAFLFCRYKIFQIEKCTSECYENFVRTFPQVVIPLKI